MKEQQLKKVINEVLDERNKAKKARRKRLIIILRFSWWLFLNISAYYLIFSGNPNATKLFIWATGAATGILLNSLSDVLNLKKEVKNGRNKY